MGGGDGVCVGGGGGGLLLSARPLLTGTKSEQGTADQPERPRLDNTGTRSGSQKGRHYERG